MDLLHIVSSKIQLFKSSNVFEGLKSVVHHIQMAAMAQLFNVETSNLRREDAVKRALYNLKQRYKYS